MEPVKTLPTAVTIPDSPMARYRATHRRFDYVPSAGALKAIEAHRHIDTALAGVIDRLILAGARVISGNSSADSELTKGKQ